MKSKSEDLPPGGPLVLNTGNTEFSSLDRLRAIVGAIPMQAWCTSPSGSLEFQNNAWLAYAGLTEEQANLRSWSHGVHPDDLDGCTGIWTEIQISRAPGEVQARLRRFDGEYRWFLMRIVPLRDVQGNVIKCYGTNADIDSQKHEGMVFAANQSGLLDAACQLVEENDHLREEFRDLFDEAPIPYVHEGLDSRFIRANRAAMKLLGIAPDDVAGTFGNTFVADTPENVRRLREAFASVGSGKETGGVVLELCRKDSNIPLWVQWWSRPGRSGKFTRTVLVDITDQVLMEQTKTALEFSLESGQVGDWDLDLIRDTSRRSLRHDRCFGYDKPIPEADWGVEDFIGHVHAEDRAHVASGFRKAVEGLLDWESEFRVVWPDRTVHWLDARGRVYRTNAGKATRMLGIVVDITERKKAEETLRATKAALEFALESGQIGDWDLDLIHDTSVRSLRHDQCFGYIERIAEADWGFEVFIHHVHPEDRPKVQNSFGEAVSNLLDWACEFRVNWADGSVHWLDARGRIYRTIEGKATRMLGVVMDITDRTRAEQTIRASEQLVRGQMEALKTSLDALATEPDPDRLLGHILRTITEQFGAHSSSVWRRDDANGMIGFEYAFEDGRVVSKFDSRFAGLDLWLPMEEFWPWPDVFRTGQASLIEDIRNVPPFALRDRLLPLGVVTVLLIPMSIVGRLEGAIGLRFTSKRAFRPEEMELAQALANQAMLAMRLTQLYAQSRESAVIAERNRMARDIYDTLAQGFIGVIVQLEAAADARSRGMTKESEEHCGRAAGLARESLQEARRSVQALRPHILEETDLCEALETLFRKMTASTSITPKFRLHGQPVALPPRWEEGLLRIAQESLNNTLRHAQATHFSADLFFGQDELKLELRDDGGGFDVTTQHLGFGLLGIRERSEAMGGTVTIKSTNLEGTTVSVQVPLASDKMDRF